MSTNDNEVEDNLKINLYNSPKIDLKDLSDLSFSNDIQEDERRNSVFIPRPQLFLEEKEGKEEKEDILINISKHQRKMSDYSTESDSISFSGRENILEWCHNILDTVNLTKSEKSSIFYRFCTAYDFIMEKLFLIHCSIKEPDELKTFIITIFLLTYKLEGLSIAKISISNLIDAFLSAMKIDKKELSDKILQNEIKILELTDFNPQIFDDNNIFQLSYILFDLFKKKYQLKLSEKDEEKIENAIDYLNNSIEFSDKMLFNLFPIDKGIISFYSASFYVFSNNKDIFPKLKDFLEYLKNKSKILKTEEEVIEGYAMIYFESIKQQGI
jgi:hypothetical protein